MRNGVSFFKIQSIQVFVMAVKYLILTLYSTYLMYNFNT